MLSGVYYCGCGWSLVCNWEMNLVCCLTGVCIDRTQQVEFADIFGVDSDTIVIAESDHDSSSSSDSNEEEEEGEVSDGDDDNRGGVGFGFASRGGRGMGMSEQTYEAIRKSNPRLASMLAKTVEVAPNKKTAKADAQLERY
eukprot:TRINITY_DN850_c2_g1_i1.p1 TRINITY_DN850_c2_g1~~TRINITY_DN850_c2_g1_i1.p1  ORF type:complete len:141 (+),score=34.25 TRINITY_DN850_c2_g1_i1:82-504(+)